MKCSHCITSNFFGCLATTFVPSFCTTTCGSTPTFDFVNLTSSPIDLLCGSISNGYIYDYFAFIVGVVFIYSYS